MKKKKTILFLIAGFFAASGHAQTDDKTDNIDWQEDSTEIVSVQDIINEQQQLTAHNMRESHFIDVWSRKSYINLSYTTTELEPDGKIWAGYNDELLSTMKSKWGISLQSGRSYRLHPDPIANTVQFYVDYTWIDLTANYFDEIGDGPYRYNSADIIDEDEHYYMPWNLKKYEASYGMNVGPSITVCPFNYIDVPELHYLQLHFYYHIGYQVTGILISDDEDADENTDMLGYTDTGKRHKQMKDNLKGEWGHGMMNSVGFSVSWKGIGLGYEHVSAKPTMKPFSTGDFGKDDDKFKISRNRLFIQFRM